RRGGGAAWPSETEVSEPDPGGVNESTATVRARRPLTPVLDGGWACPRRDDLHGQAAACQAHTGGGGPHPGYRRQGVPRAVGCGPLGRRGPPCLRGAPPARGRPLP